jgi:HK97 family phage major capsid protein
VPFTESQLKTELRSVEARILQLSETPRLTEHEEQEWRGLTRRHDQLRAMGQAIADPKSWHDGTPQVMRHVDAWTDDGRLSSVRDRALAALDATADLMPADQQAMCERLVREDDQFAREYRAHSDPNYESGWWKLLLHGEVRGFAAMTEPERYAFTRAMGETLGTSGGYGVPVSVDPSIVLSAQGSANPFRRIARVTQTTSNKVTGVSSAGVAAGWGNEFDVVADGAPTLGQPSWTVDKAHAWIPFSMEVSEDYVGFREEMAALLASAKDELEAYAFVNGTGVAPQPLGIVTSCDATTASEVTCGVAGQLTGADVSKVWVALPDRFKDNAKWMMSYGVSEHLALLADTTTGTYLSTQTITLTDAGISRLRGKEVTYSSYFPAWSTTTGHYNYAVVGDWSHYRIIDRIGMTIELVPVLFDQATARPNGTRGFYAHWRLAAGPDTVNAFRILQSV